MNKYYLIATNAYRWKYQRINLQLRYSNNADAKKFQQLISLNFRISQSDRVQKLLRWYGFQPSQSATTIILWWYGKGYHFLNDTMLLDMIQTQVQN